MIVDTFAGRISRKRDMIIILKSNENDTLEYQKD